MPEKPAIGSGSAAPVRADAAKASSSTSPKPISIQAGTPGDEKLTAEEQMARYEKELKEDDWGHQPC